jgi:hypothetical protein
MYGNNYTKEESIGILDRFQNPTEYINFGFQLRNSIATTSDTLGCFLFIDITMCLFVSIIGSYFTPLILDAINFEDSQLGSRGSIFI